jgi:hypothetical protein
MNKRRHARRRDACLGTWLLAAALCGHDVLMAKPAAAAETPPGVIELDETVISGNQELPKVLYIVPWQQPDGLPEIELKTEFAEVELFRRLYPPAYRRELGYYGASQATAESKANDSKE